MMRFKNKIVLVLGGTGHIGSVVASAFEKEGAIVCRHGRAGEYAGEADDEDQMRSMVEKILDRFSGIDVLVNCLSAPVKIASADKKTWSDFLEHLGVQLKAAVNVAQLVLPVMKKQKWGRIINILTSYVIGQPPAGLADYITAKYAMLGLTKAWAKEWGKYNITVNAVSPSFIKNNFTQNVPEKLGEIIISQTPLGRLATAEDAAGAVLFLASSEAAYVTGQNIVVAGGNVML